MPQADPTPAALSPDKRDVGIPASINADIVAGIEEAAADFGDAFNLLHIGLLTQRHDRSALLNRVQLALGSLDEARRRLTALASETA